MDKLAGLDTVIFAERDRKLEEARNAPSDAARGAGGCVSKTVG